jgi:Na+/melibiose symporter-like transporter
MIAFTRKLSGAVALFLVSNGLALAGYVLPVEQVLGGVTQLVEQSQPGIFILILRLMFAFVPIVFVGLGLLFAFRYPLSSQVHRRLCRVLERRRREEPEDPETRREAEDLSRILIGD